MNSRALRSSKWISTSLLFVCSLAMIGSSSGQLDAQDKPPIKDPLTDPQAQTQTRALPTTQKPTTHQPATQQPATQQPKKQIKRPQNPNAKKEKVEIPAPEDLILDTTDGVRLKCTYFAPPKIEKGESKPVVPFILLHEWDGDRKQLLGYASFLQRAGHAAIVPDLRGHGESTEVTGVTKPIDYKKFRKSDVMSAQKDIECCKKFLVQQHNKGELNVDLLCVVAIGQTSVLAAQWTLNDWFAYPPKNTKGIKQGQDVKALMLISPVKKLSGISILPILSHPLFTGANGPALPMLVTWGASDETAKDTEAIVEMLEKDRPDVSAIQDPKVRSELTTFFSVPIRKYKFTGLEMIESERVENFWPHISNTLFEQKVVANAKNFPWVSREPNKDEDDQ